MLHEEDITRNLFIPFSRGDLPPASDIEEEKEEHLVYAGAGLSETPDVRKWEKNVRRLSLMENQIENLSEVPTCPYLRTLFLNNNAPLRRIDSGFFQSMPRLNVLNLSGIAELPKELNALVNLTCLNLEETWRLTVIPRRLISSFSSLHVLRIFGSGYSYSDGMIGNGEFEQLCGFRRSKSLDVSALADLKRLNRLKIAECYGLAELKMDYKSVVQNTGQSFVFHSLKKFQISYCKELKDLTFLIFAPNLKSIEVDSCYALEEIVSDVPESIYRKPLPFPHLKEMKVIHCLKLKKLPLDSNRAKERKIVIRGSRESGNSGSGKKSVEGLPLALITIARATACKKTLEDQIYAIQVLRTSSSQFPGLENEDQYSHQILVVDPNQCIFEDDECDGSVVLSKKRWFGWKFEISCGDFEGFDLRQFERRSAVRNGGKDRAPGEELISGGGSG
ncbi:Disease resistance protein SUMM2 [Citrus sinensis]|nr:Disease resistance protein SUMM2 [Citrus sinensis]